MRALFLAVPDDVHADFFQQVDIREIVKTRRITLLVYSPISEEIVLWIE